MNAREIAQRLALVAEAYCKHLLPSGKREGSEWRIGSVNGEAGRSLGIHLEGEKAGVWSDFAAGASGDLLDLTMQARGCSLVGAIKEAKSFLCISETRFHGHNAKQYQKPLVPKCTTPKAGSPVFEYLTKERKLTPETIGVYKIGEEKDSIIFPFIRNGEPLMVKRLKRERENGKKDIRPTSKDQEPCLFGWHTIPDNARVVFITEGEIDAMSLYQLGHPALSVPFGGGVGAKQAWIENEYERLERFDTIYLVMDGDAEGKAAAKEIADRLGRHRCRIVDLPFKDANECLQKGVTPDQMKEFITDAYTLDPAELKPSSCFNDEVIKEFFPPPGHNSGFLTPWFKVKGNLKFRPGEVSVHSGVNGHGKSELAGHITLDAMSQGEKVCVASLEFKPPKWIYRITRQAAGIESPAVPYIKAIQKWLTDKLWVFDVVGTAKSQRILEVFAYARQRYGIELFVIDNLSKLDIGLDDYNKQRDFVDQLTDFAKEHDVHVILITHARKQADDSKPSGKMDVKGSGSITDLVDTVLIIWRNRPKEARIKEHGDGISQETLNQPDAVLICEKQRNGEDEPRIKLWFDKASHQFLESPGSKPKQYVKYSSL